MAAILVIEDVPAVLLSLRIVLESSGHTVTAAADGAAGIALIEGGRFDLVVSDIWMPGLSGVDVIRRGRAKSPATRFLAISGGDPNSHAQASELSGRDFGADRVLIKPFEKADLLDAVTSLLG